MPRPQKYTDPEIMAVMETLRAEGGEVNPMRVRMRLGGGNVTRIKAVIASMPRRETRPARPSPLPQSLMRELQQVTSETARALKQLGQETAELAQGFGSLQSALRNAESDVRAAQRLIDNFERNRREDRDEIRSLQMRIEGLVGEIGALKAKASGGQQKGRTRAAKAPGSRPR